MSGIVGCLPNNGECPMVVGYDDGGVGMLEQLHNRRFVGVFGASGAGKSSLLRAGVWSCLVVMPGAHSFDELAACLSAETDQGLYVWHTDPKRRHDAACQLGPMPEVQWRQYFPGLAYQSPCG